MAEQKHNLEEHDLNADPEREDREQAVEPSEEKPCCAAEKARAEEYYQRMIRLQADFENLRRRTRQEKEEWFRLATEELMQGLLPVLDNFDLALANPGNDLDQFLAGVRMIRRQLTEYLRAQGLEPFESAGETFDPARHEAMAQVAGTEHPENTVVEELRRGYLFRGRVLRPALVKVAKSETEAGGNIENDD